MYLDDVVDLAELEGLQHEAESRLAIDCKDEQSRWDLEDVQDRILEVKAQLEAAKPRSVEQR
jgi:hypothetical protein